MLEAPQHCSLCKESRATRGRRELFLKAVSVWINKPHVVNRRLCGSTVHHVRRCNTKTEAEKALIELKESSKDRREGLTQWEEGHTFKELSEEKHPYIVIVRELIPKSEFFPRLQEALLYDKEKASLTFFPLNWSSKEKEAEKVLPTKELSYFIQFNEIEKDMPGEVQMNKVTLAWSCECDQTLLETHRTQMTSKWLRLKLLNKVASWSEVSDITTSATSLLLVAVDKYKDTYIRLKNTYGRELVKNWPERTDPKKFVYEDLNIAAYLLLIWEEDREKKGLKEKQSFVDLGCGNGLLTYILTKEGHKGRGIDLRKRKIWDMFESDVDLREEAIKPSSEQLFEDYDWVIGNHSDELTPWIPVIAARSSPTCSFFVLPCCRHDFVGKFSETKKGESRYGTYMNYVKEIVVRCGFVPEVDTLRIPSTKRICFVGRQRTYNPEEEQEVDKRRQAFIDERTHLTQQKGAQIESSSSSSEPSSPTESVDVNHSSQGNESQSFQSPTKPGIGLTLSLKPISNGLSSWDSGYSSQENDNSSQESEMKRLDSPMESRSAFFLKLKPFDRLGRSDSGGSTGSAAISPVDIEVSHPFSAVQKCDGSSKRVLQQTTEPFHNPTMSETKKMRTNSDQDSGHAEQSKRTAETKWAPDFKPRSETGVRNCQSVRDDTKSQIVEVVFRHVFNSDEDVNEVQIPEGKRWRSGGSVSLSVVAALFDKPVLQELKAECGGLQTLLRNHSHVFQVKGGQVKLRDFSQADPWKGSNPHKRQASKARAEQRDTRKTTLCYFNEHHPDGCPLSSSECSFAHGQLELREKPKKDPSRQLPQNQQIMVH